MRDRRLMMGIASLYAAALMSDTGARAIEITPDDDPTEATPPPLMRSRAEPDREKRPGWNKPNILKKYRKKVRP